MNKQRLWMTNDHIVIREWTQEEYNNLDPTIHIHEDVLWNVCMNCGKLFSPTTQIVENMNGNNPCKHFCWECKRKEYNLIFRPKNRNNGYAYVKTELNCLETVWKDIDGKQCVVTTVY